MPPKRKNPKTEENTKVMEESTNEVTTGKKTKKVAAEPTSRTLRPRKEASPVKSAQPKKQAAKKGKKELNGVSKEKESKAKQGKKTKNTSNDEGPPAKLSKDAVEEEAENDVEPDVNATSIYEFTANDINGESVPLSKYKGHVCIIVNVASKCGHTSSNYKEFVEIYDKYGKSKGLRILAFPCNQFGKQEPGDNEKICEFAKKKNVKFDMFEKIEVNGDKAHPLWKYLTNEIEGPKGKIIDWNFTKFLINNEGKVVERFKPSVKPSALVKELEKLW